MSERPAIGDLLEAAIGFIARYVVLPSEAEQVALALFTAHSYAIEAAHATPYLLVTSPERRSGKTRTLEVIELLVARPWRVASASEAAIFRKIAKSKPTLMLDEIDAIFNYHSDRGSIAPRDVAEWIAWLCDEQAQGRRAADEKAREDRKPGKPLKGRESGTVRLSDATVRRIVSPLRACFATARREGLIRSNPCDGVPLPHRPQIEEADQPEKAKALTREQLAMFLRIVPTEWRLLFEVLSATGLRWSELAALRWSDLALDGSESNVRVRRALAKRQPRGEPRYKPPKSRHGLRSIPLDASLCRKLRQRRIECEASDDDLVFPARNGAPLRQENVRRRVLAVAAEEAGVPWIGFHTFRHTCASLLFAAGRNVKQVQRWLGHHSPGFTLDTYVHLLDDGVGGGLDLASELAQGESKVRPDQSVQAETNGEIVLSGIPS